jgi:peptidoglycan hydrolase-like amidase
MMWRFFLLVFCSFSASAQTVQIGVFSLFHPTRLEIRPLHAAALVVSTDHSRFVLNGEPGRTTVIVTLAEGHMVLDSDPARSITVAARDGSPSDFVLSVPGKIVRRYHGILSISTDKGQLIPVIAMDIETATASIVAAESPPGAPIEAQKAQAVAARSFLYAAGRRHRYYDFCDTTHCQFLREPPAPETSAFAAVLATRGLILTWRGSPVATMYVSRCGGRTASLQEVGLSMRGYPYFAVRCAYCSRRPAPSTHALGYAGAGGPRIGMCQYGAAGMAAEGASYATILRHYYPETELASIPR